MEWHLLCVLASIVDNGPGIHIAHKSSALTLSVSFCFGSLKTTSQLRAFNRPRHVRFNGAPELHGREVHNGID